MISPRALCMLLLPSFGCVIWMRDPDAYREELVELVEERKVVVEQCYDALLARQQLEIEQREREGQGEYADIGSAVTRQIGKAEGLVVVEFRVAPETGEIEPLAVDGARTTAPAPAVDCVIDSMKGMKIDPPDEREGRIMLAFKLDVGRAAKTRSAPKDPVAPDPEPAAPAPEPPAPAPTPTPAPAPAPTPTPEPAPSP